MAHVGEAVHAGPHPSSKDLPWLQDVYKHSAHLLDQVKAEHGETSRQGHKIPKPCCNKAIGHWDLRLREVVTP